MVSMAPPKSVNHRAVRRPAGRKPRGFMNGTQLPHCRQSSPSKTRLGSIDGARPCLRPVWLSRMIAGAEATAWSASRLSPNAAKASGLLSHPPGSVGKCSRPATTKLLACPLASAAQRCVKSACAWLGFEVNGPRLPLKLDVGLWIVTVPFRPNCDEALTLTGGIA